MDEDREPGRRADLLDADDEERLMNEILFAVFLPALTATVVLMVVFRRYLDSFLLSLGLDRMKADPMPFIALESGFGRFLLLAVVGAAMSLVYVGVYVRYLRSHLKERDLV